MKHFYCILSAFIISIGTGFSQNRYTDLVERMSFYSIDSYRAAVNDLKQKFSGTYHPGDKWEKALEELEQNRKAYTDGLQQQDAKIEKKVVRLLDCLDAALLANPLLEGKKVVAIKRELGKMTEKL